MKLSPYRVARLLLLLVFVVSNSADLPQARNSTPTAQTISNDPIVPEKYSLFLDGSCGQGIPATEGAISSGLASLGDFSDRPPKVQDHSAAYISSLCSSVNDPGKFLLASLDGTVLSIDCESGMKQWALQTGSALSYSEWAISGDDASECVLYSGEDWNLYEYCTDSGFKKLDLSIEEYVHNTPKIRGPEVTIGSKVSTIYLLDADSGEELHKEKLDGKAVSAPKSGQKIVLSKLDSGKTTTNYIVVVRTDYYLNCSVLGRPLWNLMDSRISATYINNEVPGNIGADIEVLSAYQKDLPVYFPRKVNKAMLANSNAPMLPPASVVDNNIGEANPKTVNMLQIVYDDTMEDHLSGNINECASGTCIMSNPSETKMFYELSSLQSQSQSSHLSKDTFEHVSSAPEDSLRLTNSSLVDNYSNLGNLYGRRLEPFYGFLPILMFFTFIVSLALFFRKKHDPIKQDKLSTHRRKRKVRKAVNMKNDAITDSRENIISYEKQNTENNLQVKFQSIDTKLVNISGAIENSTGEGRLVGKLFVSNTEIGRGSNGTVVYEGVYEGRAVAVKRLLRVHHDVAFKEIQNLVASDQHPNIVRWYGVEQDQDFVYICLERCMSSLCDLIQFYSDCSSVQTMNSYMASDFRNEHKAIFDPTEGIEGGFKLWTSNGLPSPRLVKLLRDVVSGVAHLHELGIIHRDLKPQNVLITEGRILTAKVSDMGISKRLQEDMSSLSHHATGYGSTGWQAPEQLRRDRQTRAVDLFSLGCILFFCITKGEHPFGSHYERDVNIVNNKLDLFLVDHIPEAVDLLSKLLNPEPKMRPNAVDVLHHPFFWSPEKRLMFLRDTSDRIELEDRDNETELLKALQGAGPVAFGGKWGEKLDSNFVNDMGRYRRYNFESTRDLLRLVRNKLNHYRELPKELQEILGLVPEGFDQYFSTRFPRLLIEVYKVIGVHCREEDCFIKYFQSSMI